MYANPRCSLRVKQHLRQASHQPKHPWHVLASSPEQVGGNMQVQVPCMCILPNIPTIHSNGEQACLLSRARPPPTRCCQRAWMLAPHQASNGMPTKWKAGTVGSMVACKAHSFCASGVWHHRHGAQCHPITPQWPAWTPLVVNSWHLSTSYKARCCCTCRAACMCKHGSCCAGEQLCSRAGSRSPCLTQGCSAVQQAHLNLPDMLWQTPEAAATLTA